MPQAGEARRHDGYVCGEVPLALQRPIRVSTHWNANLARTEKGDGDGARCDWIDVVTSRRDFAVMVLLMGRHRSGRWRELAVLAAPQSWHCAPSQNVLCVRDMQLLLD